MLTRPPHHDLEKGKAGGVGSSLSTPCMYLGYLNLLAKGILNFGVTGVTVFKQLILLNKCLMA